MTQYSYSLDEEEYYGGFGTPDDAAAEAFYENPEYTRVWVAEIVEIRAHDYVFPHAILDGIAESAFDDTGEASCGWLGDLSAEQVQEFGNLIGDWLESHDPVRFFKVENAREMRREALEGCGG